MIIGNSNSREIFEGLELKEHTLYKAKVKAFENNPAHIAFLFIGYKDGGYSEVYNNNYDQPVEIHKMYSIEIIKELSKLK